MTLELEPESIVEQEAGDPDELVRDLQREEEKTLPQDLLPVGLSSSEEDYPRDNREDY